MHPSQPEVRTVLVRGFYIHAAVYAVVNLVLVIVNLIKTPQYFWAKWVLLDWGVGLGTHAWIAFRTSRLPPDRAPHVAI